MASNVQNLFPGPNKSAEQAAVEEAVKKIASHKGVHGIIIVTGDGVPIRSTVDADLTIQYAGLATRFVNKVRTAMKILPVPPPADVIGGEMPNGQPVPEEDRELQIVRLRSNKHEILIAPEFDKKHDFMLLIVQDPQFD